MSDNQEKWKDKYLRSLDDLERKERLWEEAEDLLRRSVGRLAHTGYGADRSLDRQLDRVRDAVKAKKDAKDLERLAREASDTAAQLQEHERSRRDESAAAMVRLLQRLKLSGPAKRQAQRLEKKLADTDAANHLAALLGEVANLLEAAAPAASAPPAPVEAATEPTRRPGLLGRLMGNTLPPEPAPPAPAPAPPSARTLEVLLEQVEAGPGVAERLSLLRQKAAACRNEAETEALLLEAASLLSEIMRAAENADPASATVVETLPNAAEALLELMGKLEIPHHLQERLGAIKAALMRAATATQVQLVVQSVADLLGDIRREVQSEKRELESFLEGVTTRIQVLSENLLDLGQNRTASTSTRKAFHLAFREQMNGIRVRMEDTDDIETLKHAIQDGLDVIEAQMSRYVQREDQLTRETEERIADLSSRLHDMKNEAFLLQQKMQEQRHLAMTDPLTGVANRMAFDEHMETEFNRWKRYGDPLSLCVLDIDHFKKINDTFGHLAGDKALKAMALRLTQNVRKVDVVARYGGEEFVVIMPKTPTDQAYRVAEKLRSVIAAAGFHYQQQPVNITVSCGVASFRPGDDAAGAFKRADDALYAAKQGGRNRTHCADDIGTTD